MNVNKIVSMLLEIECLNIFEQKGFLTLAPLHPHRNASSCAKISPKPNMTPLMNGKIKLIAAVRINDSIVGGLYNVTTELEDELLEVELGMSSEGYESEGKDVSDWGDRDGSERSVMIQWWDGGQW